VRSTDLPIPEEPFKPTIPEAVPEVTLEEEKKNELGMGDPFA
jgi:hypothetical protein